MAQGLNHMPIIKETNINKINTNIKREQKTGTPAGRPAGIFNFLLIRKYYIKTIMTF
jgi:hypothetical protein